MPRSQLHSSGRRPSQPPLPGGSWSRRGFTLTELLVVAAIVLVVTLAAVGAYANLRQSRTVRTAAEAIQSAFVAARAYAITTNGTYRVVIQMRDPATGTVQPAYWIDEVYRGDDSPPITNTPTAAKTPKLSTPERLPEDVDLFDVAVTQSQTPELSQRGAPATNNYALIRFFADGSSDAAAVRLVRAGQVSAGPGNPHAYTVRLDSATAKPKLVAAQTP